MNRLLVLDSAAARERAATLMLSAPYGSTMELRPPGARTREQNARMWMLLTSLSRQLSWQGQTYSPEDWKDFFVLRLGLVRWMPDENGGLVPVGFSTSRLSAEQHRQLTQLIEEFAARQEILL
jgi:NinB protein